MLFLLVPELCFTASAVRQWEDAPDAAPLMEMAPEDDARTNGLMAAAVKLDGVEYYVFKDAASHEVYEAIFEQISAAMSVAHLLSCPAAPTKSDRLFEDSGNADEADGAEADVGVSFAARVRHNVVYWASRQLVVVQQLFECVHIILKAFHKGMARIGDRPELKNVRQRMDVAIEVSKKCRPLLLKFEQDHPAANGGSTEHFMHCTSITNPRFQSKLADVTRDVQDVINTMPLWIQRSGDVQHKDSASRLLDVLVTDTVFLGLHVAANTLHAARDLVSWYSSGGAEMLQHSLRDVSVNIPEIEVILQDVTAMLSADTEDIDAVALQSSLERLDVQCRLCPTGSGGATKRLSGHMQELGRLLVKLCQLHNFSVPTSFGSLCSTSPTDEHTLRTQIHYTAHRTKHVLRGLWNVGYAACWKYVGDMAANCDALQVALQSPLQDVRPAALDVLFLIKHLKLIAHSICTSSNVFADEAHLIERFCQCLQTVCHTATAYFCYDSDVDKGPQPVYDLLSTLIKGLGDLVAEIAKVLEYGRQVRPDASVAWNRLGAATQKCCSSVVLWALSAFTRRIMTSPSCTAGTPPEAKNLTAVPASCLEGTKDMKEGALPNSAVLPQLHGFHLLSMHLQECIQLHFSRGIMLPQNFDLLAVGLQTALNHASNMLELYQWLNEEQDYHTLENRCVEGQNSAWSTVDAKVVKDQLQLQHQRAVQGLAESEQQIQSLSGLCDQWFSGLDPVVEAMCEAEEKDEVQMLQYQKSRLIDEAREAYKTAYSTMRNIPGNLQALPAVQKHGREINDLAEKFPSLRQVGWFKAVGARTDRCILEVIVVPEKEETFFEKGAKVIRKLWDTLSRGTTAVGIKLKINGQEFQIESERSTHMFVPDTSANHVHSPSDTVPLELHVGSHSFEYPLQITIPHEFSTAHQGFKFTWRVHQGAWMLVNQVNSSHYQTQEGIYSRLHPQIEDFERKAWRCESDRREATPKHILKCQMQRRLEDARNMASTVHGHVGQLQDCVRRWRAAVQSASRKIHVDKSADGLEAFLGEVPGKLEQTIDGISSVIKQAYQRLQVPTREKEMHVVKPTSMGVGNIAITSRWTAEMLNTWNQLSPSLDKMLRTLCEAYIAVRMSAALRCHYICLTGPLLEGNRAVDQLKELHNRLQAEDSDIKELLFQQRHRQMQIKSIGTSCRRHQKEQEQRQKWLVEYQDALKQLEHVCNRFVGHSCAKEMIQQMALAVEEVIHVTADPGGRPTLNRSQLTLRLPKTFIGRLPVSRGVRIANLTQSSVDLKLKPSQSLSLGAELGQTRLAPGNGTSISVTGKTEYAVDIWEVLEVFVADLPLQLVVHLEVQPYRVQFRPSSLAFGTVAVGKTDAVTKVVEVKNPTDADLLIKAEIEDGGRGVGFFLGGKTEWTIAPGATDSVQVQYHSAGAPECRSGALCLYVSPSDRFDIPLEGKTEYGRYEVWYSSYQIFETKATLQLTTPLDPFQGAHKELLLVKNPSAVDLEVSLDPGDGILSVSTHRLRVQAQHEVHIPIYFSVSDVTREDTAALVLGFDPVSDACEECRIAWKYDVGHATLQWIAGARPERIFTKISLPQQSKHPSIVPGSVAFRNTGEAALQFKLVVCGTSMLQITPEAGCLKSYESCEVQFRPIGHKQQLTSNSVVDVVMVTSDVHQKEVRFQVEVNVVRPFLALPQHIFVDSQSGTGRFELKVKNTGDQTLYYLGKVPSGVQMEKGFPCFPGPTGGIKPSNVTKFSGSWSLDQSQIPGMQITRIDFNVVPPFPENLPHTICLTAYCDSSGEAPVKLTTEGSSRKGLNFWELCAARTWQAIESTQGVASPSAAKLLQQWRAVLKGKVDIKAMHSYDTPFPQCSDGSTLTDLFLGSSRSLNTLEMATLSLLSLPSAIDLPLRILWDPKHAKFGHGARLQSLFHACELALQGVSSLAGSQGNAEGFSYFISSIPIGSQNDVSRETYLSLLRCETWKEALVQLARCGRLSVSGDTMQRVLSATENNPDTIQNLIRAHLRRDRQLSDTCLALLRLTTSGRKHVCKECKAAPFLLMQYLGSGEEKRHAMAFLHCLGYDYEVDHTLSVSKAAQLVLKSVIPDSETSRRLDALLNAPSACFSGEVASAIKYLEGPFAEQLAAAYDFVCNKWCDKRTGQILLTSLAKIPETDARMLMQDAYGSQEVPRLVQRWKANRSIAPREHEFHILRRLKTCKDPEKYLQTVCQFLEGCRLAPHQKLLPGLRSHVKSIMTFDDKPKQRTATLAQLVRAVEGASHLNKAFHAYLMNPGLEPAVDLGFILSRRKAKALSQTAWSSWRECSQKSELASATRKVLSITPPISKIISADNFPEALDILYKSLVEKAGFSAVQAQIQTLRRLVGVPEVTLDYVQQVLEDDAQIQSSELTSVLKVITPQVSLLAVHLAWFPRDGASSCAPAAPLPRGHLPSFVWTRHGAVKQGKSGGSVGTTSRGKGKASREGKTGQGGRRRTRGGGRPTGTTADGGKGSKGRAANGDRPIGAARCRREQCTKGDIPNPPPHHDKPAPVRGVTEDTLAPGTA